MARKKKIIEPHELIRRKHRAEAKRAFAHAGFKSVGKACDKLFTFKNVISDIDGIFLLENVIVLCEYVCKPEDKIRDHLYKSSTFYEPILDNKVEFIKFMEEKFPAFKEARDQNYSPAQCKVIALYCSRYPVNSDYKTRIPVFQYFDYPILKYFLHLSSAIKHSARFELFDYFRLKYSDIGNAVINPAQRNQVTCPGSLLSEDESGFKEGYKVVSFYIQPSALLHRAYVFRKDGWIDSPDLYQRMIDKNKIRGMRQYLADQNRVFINNIIVTLPPKTELLDEKGEKMQPSEAVGTQPIQVRIPDDFHTVGIVDGQHRLFAYHEADEKIDSYEKFIRIRRMHQNLLVTGIVYPKEIKTTEEKMQFEAKLFVEINSTQTNVKSNLIQEIEVSIKPLSGRAIAKSIINNLSEVGPLKDHLQKHFYEQDKIKTTSIVSYGLRPTVKTGTTKDLLFSSWSKRSKRVLLEKKEEITDEQREILEGYRQFCTTQINTFLAAAKARLEPSGKWMIMEKGKERGKGILSPTSINGLILCLKHLVENGKLADHNSYLASLKGLEDFPFHSYRSSRWGKMAADIYKEYFA